MDSEDSEVSSLVLSRPSLLPSLLKDFFWISKKSEKSEKTQTVEEKPKTEIKTTEIDNLKYSEITGDIYKIDVEYELLVYEGISYTHNIYNEEIYDSENNLIGLWDSDKIEWQSDDEKYRQHSQTDLNIVTHTTSDFLDKTNDSQKYCQTTHNKISESYCFRAALVHLRHITLTNVKTRQNRERNDDHEESHEKKERKVLRASSGVFQLKSQVELTKYTTTQTKKCFHETQNETPVFLKILDSQCNACTIECLP